MKRTTWKLLQVLITLSWWMGAGAMTWAGEFKVDANTLFLAHYNTTLNADYSQGEPDYDSMDTGYVTPKGGWIGGGLAARVGDKELKEVGAQVDDAGLSLKKAFDGLRYAAPGNIDFDKGTFECWVKPFFSARRPKDIAVDAPLQYPVLSYTERSGKYFVLVFNQNESGKTYCVFAIINNAVQVDSTKEVKWEPNEWHHLAATWDMTVEPPMAALYVDGQLARKVSLRTLPEGFPGPSQQFPYFCIGAWAWRKAGAKQFGRADAVIDEVRISNVVRYDNMFEPESQK